MGIHGLLAQLGPGERISFAKLSSTHFTTHSRPFRLAIDISIWLFQIQCGKGGSNPALRTFYYRLLRLLTLNIHPLFVFDGPNKPTFKRHKKVGGPGVRVASVPEFLAKQLLKQFGFPWHVAPGEAEAECALLQREGIVDAVLSEDVDTLMFGSGVTLRNWTSENTTKSPTHVNIYRAEETKERSRGLEREGMVLVALMSGGDYLPEGIPGCGPKVACDAARAGFGTDLCALSRKDTAGIYRWKERLQHEIRTNESKFFKRRNTSLVIPEDFPNLEVLGYYTHPCVSTPDKLARLEQELRWDQPIDFDALRSFTADAFDWRCLGGAKKFIKNLAPAMLVRELRLRGDSNENNDDQELQEQREQQLVQAIHGKRNHSTTDGELEYRITFIPSSLVPIDLSLEEEDDQFIPAGGSVAGAGEESDAESEFMTLPSSTPANDPNDSGSEAPISPAKKKRNFRPFDPSNPEKLWILRPFLQIGCPLLVEDHEASFNDPKEFLKARRKARAAAKGDGNTHAPSKNKGGAKKGKDSKVVEASGNIMSYAKVTKHKGHDERGPPLKDVSLNTRSTAHCVNADVVTTDLAHTGSAMFRMPSTQIPEDLSRESTPRPKGTSQTYIEVLDLAVEKPTSQGKKSDRPATAPNPTQPSALSRRIQTEAQKTPKRSKKRLPPDLSSPAMSQRTITSFYSPSPHKTTRYSAQDGIINLISSSPAPVQPSPQGQQPVSRPLTPTPPNIRINFVRAGSAVLPAAEFSPGKLPDTVTKRRKKGPLKRWQTEPGYFGLNYSCAGDGEDLLQMPSSCDDVFASEHDVEGGGFLLEDELESTPRPQPNEADAPSAVSITAAGDENISDIEDKVDWWIDDAEADGKHTILTDTAPPWTTTTISRDQARPHSAPKAVSATKRATPKPNQASKKLPLRQSPRQHVSARSTTRPDAVDQHKVKKKRIELRESLEGWWKEIEADTVDLSGDGSGWKLSGRRAEIVGWRKSGVEVLDLTGA